MLEWSKTPPTDWGMELFPPLSRGFEDQRRGGPHIPDRGRAPRFDVVVVDRETKTEIHTMDHVVVKVLGAWLSRRSCLFQGSPFGAASRWPAWQCV